MEKWVYVIERYGADYDIVPGILLSEEERNGKKVYLVYVIQECHRYQNVFDAIYYSLEEARQNI